MIIIIIIIIIIIMIIIIIIIPVIIYNNNNNNNNNNVIYTFLLGAFLSSKRFTWIRKRRKIRKISILGDILYIL